MAEPIGLIAGGGALPRLEAEGMRAAGHAVIGVGLAGNYGDEVPGLCERFGAASMLRPRRWARLIRRGGARQAVMVGTVSKTKLLYDPMRWIWGVPDRTAIGIYLRQRRRDQRSQTMLGVLADELGKLGVELIDTTRYIPDHLATAGVMTRRGPTGDQQADVDFGWSILMRLNELDIGQALVVRARDVIAVEAIEGTDRMIERAGGLAGKGWTLIKGAPEDKDRRFDVPTVGVQTIANLKAAGAGCLAVAAGRTILVDKPEVLRAADEAGIALVGVAG